MNLFNVLSKSLWVMLCLYRPRHPHCVQPSWTLPSSKTGRRRIVWNGNNLWGDLNLAYERCRWIRPTLPQVMKMCQDFKAQVWYMRKTSEGSQAVHPASSWGWSRQKKRESSLLLPELQRCRTSTAWPSKASVVFDPSLHISFTLLSPWKCEYLEA